MRILAIVALTLAGLTGAAQGSHASIELVSVSTTGELGAEGSGSGVVSADGRYVAFHSFAANLVPGDSNNSYDVFVRDREAGTTERVSISSGVVQGNGDSFAPSLSLDGRYVSFNSDASNLVPGDTNGWPDVFVHDRLSHTTSLVSVGLSGEPANFLSLSVSISGNGRYVAFDSAATNLVAGSFGWLSRIFVRDRATGVTTLVSVDSSGVPGNANSYDATISSDGRSVAFSSYATNLVLGDTNEASDIFVRDLAAGTTVRASQGSLVEEARGDSDKPSISADGRRVAFQTYARGLVQAQTIGTNVYVRDLPSGTTVLVSRDMLGMPGGGENPAISGDGRFVAFDAGSRLLAPGALHEVDVYVHDLATGRTNLISGTSKNEAGDMFSSSPAISWNGRFVAFHAFRTRDATIAWNGLWTWVHTPGQIYLRDRGEPTCPQGWREEGFVTSHTHDMAEPLPGPLGPTIHDVSCEAAGFGA